MLSVSLAEYDIADLRGAPEPTGADPAPTKGGLWVNSWLLAPNLMLWRLACVLLVRICAHEGSTAER